MGIWHETVAAADVAAIKAKTDTIPTSPLGAADIAVSAQNSAANVDAVDVIGNKTDTIFGTSLVALTKKAVAFAEALDYSGTYSYTDAGGEQTVVTITTALRMILHGIWLDLTTITQNGTIKLYYKIDGTNYREVSSQAFTVATDSDGVFIDFHAGITNDFKVTYTEGGDEGADRAIPYSIIFQAKE